MAQHNTQCPHCFTTYVISDEQYRVSEGMVRCGTCQERFQAHLLQDEGSTLKFDPRQVFIEPISEDPEKLKHSNIEESEQVSFIIDNLNSDLSLDIDDNAPITPADVNKLSTIEMLNNIRAKHAREKEKEKEKGQHEDQEKSSSEHREHPVESNTETDTKAEKHSETTDSETDHDTISVEQHTEVCPEEPAVEASPQENLIDEVDTLINNKLLHNVSSKTPEKTNTYQHKVVIRDDKKTTSQPDTIETIALSSEFKITSNRRRSSVWTWVFTLPLVILIATLSSLLLYQLWAKQLIAFDGHTPIQKDIIALTNPLINKLEKNNLTLPVRRSLSKLELLSARTEAHPTRPSTILLKVDILNHARISQPLPWLEMSLSDADGGLVSLRNLSPNDYIFNNNTPNQIGAKELKKITIELLSFPKQASGYELKLLNR